MKKVLLLLALLFSYAVGAQVYPMQNGTFSTCSGTFYDSGGAAGNYAAGETYQITFCPATPGTYVQLDFTAFDVEGQPFDYMRVYEGTGTAGTLIGTYGTLSPVGCGIPVASSHPSGCITITFVSDGSFQYGGWAATISCSPTPGGTLPTGPPNAVCSGANPFCADAGPLEFPNSSGGCFPDAPTVVTDNTCLITAPNPAWYYLEIGIAGNVNLEIEQTTGPNGTGTGLDVDYAIWGPFANAAATCADFTQGDCVADHTCSGNVVDCSFSIDAIETATIPNALVGQIYMVLITNFDGSPGYIRMTQTNAGTAGAGSTDCSIVCPTFAGTNPTTCGATNGSITISGLDPSTVYTVNYLDDLTPVSASVTSNATGVAIISGLNAGNYTNIVTNYAGCTSAMGNITLIAASAPSITSITSNTPICTGASAIFTINGTPNATVTYNLGAGNLTVVLNAAGTANVTIVSAAANVTLTTVSIAVPGCSVPVVISRTVMVNGTPTIVLTSTPATANQTLCVNSSITPIMYTIASGGTGATVSGLPTGVTGSFSGGQFTITGSPTVTGTFNYTVTTTGGCSFASAVGTITVNPGSTIALFSGAATTNQTLCINTPIASIIYTIGGGATGATVTGLPAGLLASYTAGQFTIVGMPTASGTFNYTVSTTGGCGTASLGGTITVNPNATIALTSAPATANQTTCINTPITSIVYTIANGATGASVTGLPTGVTGTLGAGGVFTISGTPTVTGNFNYTVTTTGGCSSGSLGGTINVNTNTTIVLFSAPATANQTTCINTAITPIEYTIGGGATGATVLGLPTGVTGSFAAGQFTISGAPTVTGTFNYTVTTTGGCASASLGGTITINTNATIVLTSAAATTSQTLCINTAITSIVYTIGGGATGATVIGLPAGVNGSFSAGQFTISGTPTASGPFNYMVTTTGGCASASLGGSITVNTGATIAQTSAAGTELQTVCINNAIGSINYTIGASGTGATVTGLPTGVTGNFAAGVFTISGTPTVSGTFNYTVTATGSGCSSPSLTGTITSNDVATIVLTSAVATANQTVCETNSITPIVYTIAGGATGANVIGLPTGVTGSFAAGQFTIIGTPTVTGTFNYTITTTGGCSSATLGGTITVDPNANISLTSAIGTDNQVLCSNTPIASIVYTVSNGATGATVIGLPTGVVGTFSAGQLTISGTPTATGVFNYTVTTTGGCASVSLAGTIAINPDATMVLTSASATTNQTLCVNNAIAAIEYMVVSGATGATAIGLPTGVTGSFATGLFTISGTPTATGIFNYTVSTTGGCGTIALSGTITINTDDTIVLTSAAATATQNLCMNTPITSIVYTVGGAAMSATVTGLPTGVTGSFATGVLTISGTPSIDGVFNYTVTTTGSCASASIGGTITVNPGPTIALTSGAATSNQILCINTAIASIDYTVGGTATGASVIGLPAGVSGSFSGGLFTISGTATVTGTFNYTISTSGGCGSVALNGSISINANDTIVLTSAAATSNQAVCFNTPMTTIVYTVGGGATGATVTGLPAGVTGSFSGGQLTISGSPIVSGTFNYTATTTGSCASASLNGTITVDPEVIISLFTFGTAIQTTCPGYTISGIEYVLGNGATGATVTGLPAGLTAGMVGGHFVISGSTTVVGIHNFVVTTTGGCGVATTGGTITITPYASITLSSAPSTINQTICEGVAIDPIIYTIGNATSASSSLPPGLTGSYFNGQYTISGTPTATGTYTIDSVPTGGCYNPLVSATLIVNANATLGQLSPAGTETQTTCINIPIANIEYQIGGSATGATISGLPTGVTGSFAAGVMTISGSPSIAGTFNYTVTATGSPCSFPALSGTITVNPNVTMVLSSAAGTANQTLCINTAITEIGYSLGNGATGATVTGLPTGVTGIFSSGVLEINGVPSVAGIFNYTVTTTGGCSSVTMNGTITVNPNVTLTLQSASGTNHQILCIGTPIIPIEYQTGNGATGVVVSTLPSGITSSYAAGIVTISGTPSVSGEFNYTVTTSGGCSLVVLAGSVSVSPNVTIGLTSAVATTSQVICANTPIVPIAYLVGNGATGATVTGLPTGVTANFAAGTLTISGTPSIGGVFNYSVTTTGGCSSATLTGNITVNLLPTATIVYAATPYCNSLVTAQPITLNGTGAYLGGTYAAPSALSINTVTGAINPSLSTAGTYTVTYTIPAFGGCPSVIATTLVTITSAPTATISYNSPYCTSVNTNQAVVLNGTAAYAGGTFTSAAGLSLNPNTGAINPFLSTPGIYTVTYTIPASGGCASVPVTTSVTINATPIAVATPDSNTICTDDTVNIGLTSLVAGTTYTWTVVQTNVSGAADGSGNLISQTLATTGNMAGTAVYTIIPTSPAGCVGNATIVPITVNPLPKPHLESGVICRNPRTGVVMRTYVLNTGLNNNDYDFLWLHNTGPIPGATDSTYEVTEDGIYTVIATNVHTGCVSYPVDATVSESEVAEIALINGNDAFVDNPTITITVVGNGNYEYQLDNGAFQSSNVFQGLTDGEHTIHVRDQYDCTDIDQTFTVIGYPKFFTPNGDGYNDTWNITALADQKTSKISIFDRYGKLIKQISPGGEGWDGTLNGHELPSTDYWFVIEYLDQQINKEFKAHFSLKR